MKTHLTYLRFFEPEDSYFCLSPIAEVILPGKLSVHQGGCSLGNILTYYCGELYLHF